MTAHRPNKAPRTGQLSIIPAAAAFDPSLGKAALRVLCALGAFANRQGRCWPATTTLAAELGISDRRVRVCLRKLEANGYLRTEHRPGQRSTYTILRKLLNPGTLASGVEPDPGTPASGGAEHQHPGTPEHQHPPNGVNNRVNNDYAFSGVVLRLTWQDFSAWQESYKAIPDLRAALQQRDDWLATLPESDRRRENWLVPTSNWLAKENQKQAASRVQTEPAYDPDVIH
jgi:hypothetical protein